MNHPSRPPRPDRLGQNQRIHDRNRPGADVHPDGHRPRQIEGARRGNIDRSINNRAVTDRIRADRDHENVRGQRWWHEHDGIRYYHYYDHHGIHWYGWYIGSAYFYTRWYMDHFWWQDPYWHRWCYWHDGYWWWINGGVTYVFIDNGYYVYQEGTGGVIVTPAPPDEQPTPDDGDEPPPAPTTNEKYFYSQDGTRAVQITAEGKAFLYDRAHQDASGADTLLAELAADGGAKATDVKFSKTQGDNLQILVIYDDGTFARFDANGARLDDNAVEVAPEVPSEARPDAPMTKSMMKSDAFESLQTPVWQ